ncbi:MAG: oligosaccharide flippase family protein [Lachnospiraceae bacterium]|nr:oligosaccharide flippase family protein [Lachnospiraceae bacterium]
MEKNSSNKVVKAGIGYVLGNILLKGITFLSAPIFTRLLTTAEYGDYNTYLSFESIFYILIGLALHSSINNAKYKYEHRLEEYVSSIVLFLFFSTGVWFLGANLCFPLYREWWGFDRLTANILIIHCLGSSLLQVYNTYISLNYSYKSYVKISSFYAISNMVLSIVLLLTLFNGQRSLGRIVGTVLPMVLVGAYITVFFFRKAKPTVSGEYWKYGLKYSLPIVPHGISQVVLSAFDRIMIKDIVGSAEAGIYSFAYTIYSLFKVMTTALEKVWKPWVYEKMDSKDYESIRKQGTNYAFGMALITSLIMMVTPEMIKILGDKEYWGSTECVIPVLIGGYFAFLYTLPSVIEYFYGKTKCIATGTMLAAGLNIVLNYIFIPRCGYIAAAYTTLVTYFLYFIFHSFLAWRIHGSSLFRMTALLGVSVGVLVVGGCTILLETAWPVRWMLEAVIGIVGLLWAERKFGISQKIKAKLKKD